MNNSDKIKRIAIDIVKTIAFTLVFFLILHTLSRTVFSGQKVATISKRMADAYAFTEDTPYTTDIVCLGSSDMYSGFVPITLWEEYGYTSVVSSCSHQSIDEAEMFLREIQKNQEPKLVLLEVDTMYDGRPTSNVIEENTRDLDQLFERLDPAFFEADVERVFSIFSFHNLWKFDGSESKRHQYSHGYLYNNEIVYLTPSEYMIKNDDIDMPTMENVNALKGFVDYCNENNLNLVFVEMPSMTSWNYERHNAMQKISDKLGVEFLDLNLCYEEIGISQEDCYRDGGNHLNYYAAVKATSYLGNYIKENYKNIADRRDDSAVADEWNKDSEDFRNLYGIS